MLEDELAGKKTSLAEKRVLQELGEKKRVYHLKKRGRQLRSV